MTTTLFAAANATTKVGWLEVSKGLVLPVLLAMVPVVLAIRLRHQQRRTERRDRLREMFSEALRAVADYQELPYMIRRRSDLSPMTREELSRHTSDVQSRLDFYVARLELETLELGKAYERLVVTARREAGEQMTAAWGENRLLSDSAMPLGSAYPREATLAQRKKCLEIMRSHLEEG